MKNPVMTASGTFGYGDEFKPFVDLNRLGGLVVKGITLKPRKGNPPPRIVETPSGMLNAIGLQNVGVDGFIQKKLPYLRNFDTAVLVNISGCGISEYVEISKRLSEAEGVAGLELNISCPNVEGGMDFGLDSKLTYSLVEAVRKSTSLPLIVKLSPNVTDIVEIALAAEAAGADAISAVNTFLALKIDIKTRKPVLANITGGLSGPAIRPIAVRMVWQIAKAVKIPIVGIGGITTAEDALEFMVAGATAVAIGTANFVNPSVSLEVIEGIAEFMRREKLSSIKELVGSIKIEAKGGV
jgi:dihydroorotate dehydrogenase (NAD+) catalytic subunit